ncbi:MAG: hypothetical protein ACLSHC_03590 [Bilophila wadsworthia]
MTSVFYKGAADQNAALLNGNRQFRKHQRCDAFINQFRVLNVAASAMASPDVPTLREAGIDMVSEIRRCFAAPRASSPPSRRCGVFKRICEILSIWPI